MYYTNDIHVHVGKSDGINAVQNARDIPEFMEKNMISKLVLISLEKDIDDTESEIESAFSHPGVYGWKMIRENSDFEMDHKNWIGAKFHGSFEKRPVSDPVYRKKLEKITRLLVHCGRYNNGDASSTTSYRHALQVAKNNPHIMVVLAHMGGNDTSIVKKAVDEARNIPNAYFETSGISAPIRVEYAVKKLGADRIFFGSDHPWCSFRGQYYSVMDALISEEERKKILFSNLEAFIV